MAIKGGMSTTRKRVYSTEESTENVRLLPEEVYIMRKLQRQDHVYELHVEEPKETRRNIGERECLIFFQDGKEVVARNSVSHATAAHMWQSVLGMDVKNVL